MPRICGPLLLLLAGLSSRVLLYRDDLWSSCRIRSLMPDDNESSDGLEVLIKKPIGGWEPELIRFLLWWANAAGPPAITIGTNSPWLSPVFPDETGECRRRIGDRHMHNERARLELYRLISFHQGSRFLFADGNVQHSYINILFDYLQVFIILQV